MPHGVGDARSRLHEDAEEDESTGSESEEQEALVAHAVAASRAAAAARLELSHEERRWMSTTAGARGEPLAHDAGVPLLPRGVAPPPLPPCSFLRPGAAFCGTQRVCPLATGAPSRQEAWKVNVRIHAVDAQTGAVCGSMEAVNVPSAQAHVETFWEGHVVDGRAHGFLTCAWGADAVTDLRHWSQFPAFAPLRPRVARGGAADVDVGALSHIFMRWKEVCFVNVSADCGLTIAGFYYVCLSRADGAIQGFYFDPASQPFQQLLLRPAAPGAPGLAAANTADGAAPAPGVRRGASMAQALPVAPPGGGPQCFADITLR